MPSSTVSEASGFVQRRYVTPLPEKCDLTGPETSGLTEIRHTSPLLCVCVVTGSDGERQRWDDDHPNDGPCPTPGPSWPHDLAPRLASPSGWAVEALMPGRGPTFGRA